MSHKKSLTNEEMAEYLDHDVPLQQLDNQLPDDDTELTFIHAQLAYAKSKQGKKAKRDKRYYQMMWRNRHGGKNDK